jgi:orotate phosphoribosyltransferase
MENRSREFAAMLLDAKAVKISFNPPFTYASGIRAPIYTDNRVLISYVKERTMIVDGMVALAQELGFGAEVVYAGTATAGIPWASFVADRLQAPMIYIRPKPKDHGTGKQIEGSFVAGSTGVIVEDLVTTGGSSLATAEVLRREGSGTVTHMFAIFTYGFEKMYKAFEEAGVALHTLTDFPTLLDVARERGDITEEQYAKILEYKEDPENWATKMGL